MANETMNNALAPVDKDDALSILSATAVEEAANGTVMPATADEDALKATIEALRAVVADLEAKEAALSEKLAQARNAELEEQIEKCRTLLLKVVVVKKQKKADLKAAEDELLAMQLDDFAAEMEKDLTHPIDKDGVTKLDDPYTAEYKRLRAKAKRGRAWAKVVGFIGVFACVVGAIAYLLLTQPSIYGLPFNWLDLAIDGAALIIVVIIASCIKSGATANDRLADEMEENLPVDIYSLDRDQLDAISEAYAIEAAEGAEKEEEKNTKTRRFAKLNLPEMPEQVKNIGETVKKNADKIIPAAAVGAALVTTVCISSSKKKAAQKRRAAAARKDFFNWLS